MSRSTHTPSKPPWARVTDGSDHANDPSPFGAGEGARPFRVLDTRRRSAAAVVYLGMALVAALLVVVSGVSLMWLTAVGVLGAAAAYQVAGAWKMRVEDIEALRIAGSEAGFDVGHGSATLGYRGWFAKPVWQVLVFEAGPQPDRQALVTVDALTGEVLGTYTETVEQP